MMDFVYKYEEVTIK